MMLRATIYLALVGAAGLREAAEQCVARMSYARQSLAAIPGVAVVYDGPAFREFVVRLPRPAGELVAQVLAEAGILAGIPLGRFEDARERELLVAVTEKRSRTEIDALCMAVAGALGAPLPERRSATAGKVGP